VTRFLVVNADDFGVSTGINRGIVEAHVDGIVTSTSCMVTGPAVEEAVAMSSDHPELSIGLHWDVSGEEEQPSIDLSAPNDVRDDFLRQLERFHELFGRAPTHVDSHKHAHREPLAMSVVQELVAPLDVPLRHDGRVRYLGHFYAQWRYLETELEHVQVSYLQTLLRDEVRDGWTELGCHPGYVTSDFDSVYLTEREVERQTLCDPRVKATIADLGIRLVNYAAWEAA
jgi:predicted glycoside hydrolase/deacetylase ChbG (UPF0249 family)